MFKTLYYFSVVLLFIALGLNLAGIFTTAVHPMIGIVAALVSVTLFYFFRYKAREEIEEERRR